MSKLADLIVDKGGSEPKPYVTTTQGMRGFFAVMMWWNPEPGFWEPWQSGIGSYQDRKDAIQEAKDWAEADGVEYKE